MKEAEPKIYIGRTGRAGHFRPLHVAAAAVALALVVVAAWCGRAGPPVVETALEGTVSVRVTKHDALGMASAKPLVVRDRARVRAIVAALAVDAHPVVPCPPDYASAELGLLLSGRDVYARRNVYVWGLASDAGTATAVVVSSAGCRGGPVRDPRILREIAEAPTN